jgi:AraC family transcriptional regulator, positive regulator of tynA and feaB
MLLFSSTDRRPEDAFALWRTAISEQFVPLRPEPVDALATFFGELTSSAIGTLTLSDIHSTGQRVHRERLEIARSQGEAFFLNVQVAGESGLVCHNRCASTRQGDIFLIDARRPFVLACETPMRHLCLSVPRDVLPGCAAELDRAHGLVLPAANAPTRLLHDYLCCISAAGDSLEGPLADEVANHLLALIGHIVRSRSTEGPTPRAAVRAALFANGCRIIERRKCDLDFNPTALAKDTRVSLRYLQAIFQEHGTSPMREIVQRRTALAMRMLREPSNAHRTITQIAFACGFRDLSHFDRVFVATTGVTPRDWRRRG